MHELWSKTTHDLSETSDDSSESSHSWFWSDRQTEDDDDDTTCALHKKSNDSDPFHIGNTYGGIPTNLITNTIGWILLLLLFIFIRKSAFEYIKKGSLVTVREHNWNKLIHVFYTVTDNPADDDVTDSRVGSAARGDIEDGEGSTGSLDRDQSLQIEHGFWSWLVMSVTMKEDKMMGIAGPDAVQYLRFQKYLLSFILLTTLLCICVILPFNFQGKLQGDALAFGHTTLANLDPRSDKDASYLYVHISISFILFPISIYIMRKFSAGLTFRDVLEITRTLQLENIPQHMCQEDLLRRHFLEAYPAFPIKDLRVAYDVSKLTSRTNELQNALDAKIYGEKYKASSGKDLRMYPVCMGRCCWCLCICCVDKVDVVDYYIKEVDRLKKEVQKERELALLAPLGMAFVSFTSVNDSKHVLDDFTRHAFLCGPTPALSSLSACLRPNRWRVTYAPPPRDIYWENLSDPRKWLTVKKVMANLILSLVALFLTTPEYIVTQLDIILYSMFGNNEALQIPTLIKDFLPTLLIWSFTALLPVLVAYSDRWLGHWYRSCENHSIMIKSFWYLWIMVLIFPTFGFTTGMALIENLLKPNENVTETEPVFRWDCIFLPDSGAFFVNYVITAAFIGSGLELIRFPELIWFALQTLFSRTKAESSAIQRAVTMEFRFGEQYARMLLMLSMVIMYSISCPLITPFGLVYFILKHFADKHNLAFVYAPSKINKNVHRSAINFVVFSVTLLQVFMVTFSFIRSFDGSWTNLNLGTKISLFLLFLTIMVFAAQTWSDFCRKMSPIKYQDVLYSDDAEEDEDQVYVPEILLRLFRPKEANQ